MANCKPGDIAFIKKALRKENIGLIVDVNKCLGTFNQGDLITFYGEVYQAIITDTYFEIWSESGSINTMYGKSKSAFSPDTWLIPINPDGLDEEDLYLTLEDEITV